MEFCSDLLAYPKRYFRVQNGKLSFGPSGERLFVDYLDKTPGFTGRIDFIHKCNITELFAVVPQWEANFSNSKPVWYADRLESVYEDGFCRMTETRFVTEKDLAVSLQQWENRTDRPLTLTLRCEPEGCTYHAESDGDLAFLTPDTLHGYAVLGRVRAPAFSGGRQMEIPPRQTVEIAVAAALGNSKSESMEALGQRLNSFFAGDLGSHALLTRHQKEYAAFFLDAPDFECSDPLLNRTWLYRWYLLKNTLARPDFGNFRHTVMFEGRSHKMGKVPFNPTGWEFTKLIPLSTPLHLTELQWMNNKTLIHELVGSLLDSQAEDGRFRVMTASGFGKSYANNAIWAIYRCLRIHPDDSFLRKILPDLKRAVAGDDNAHAAEDGLHVETVHQQTGKEYQPSYWYFHNYPQDCYDPASYTPLKRVDRSVYHYLNLVGLSRLCSLIKDPDAGKLECQAQELAAAINLKMWDMETEFYYDLHHESDEKALVRNITGFYPLWADIAQNGQERILEQLLNPELFRTEAPFPSVARDCPAYRPDGGWMDRFIKGRNGCVWCGPSWPYTTGIALDALGIQSRKLEHRYDRDFGKLLRDYALMHFRGGDPECPYLVEHYNPETGELLSDEFDYNHSYFIHLIMEHLLGIHVTAERVVIDPLDVGLDWFRCESVAIMGHRLDISYSRATGLTVVWDGHALPRPADGKPYTIEKEMLS